MTYGVLREIDPEQNFKVVPSRDWFNKTTLLGVSIDEYPNPHEKDEIVCFGLGGISLPEKYIGQKFKLTRRRYADDNCRVFEERYIFEVGEKAAPQLEPDVFSAPDEYSVQMTGTMEKTFFGNHIIKTPAGKFRIGDLFVPPEYFGKNVEFVYGLRRSKEDENTYELVCRTELLGSENVQKAAAQKQS